MPKIEKELSQHHQHRMDMADIALANWGRWKCGREIGGGGYGDSALAGFMKVRGETHITFVPTNSLEAEQTQRVLATLSPLHNQVAAAHWAKDESRNAIARLTNRAPATISKLLYEVQYSVAYPHESSFGMCSVVG